MEKYNGKYRNESRRLRGWDYSGNGHYFITINTYNRVCLFGDIVDGKMILNDFGKIATNEWYKSFDMRKELFLDAFMLMPNHLHAIVGLESGFVLPPSKPVGTSSFVGTPPVVVTSSFVGTHGRASLQGQQTMIPTQYQPQPFQRKPKSISSFVAGYKSIVLNKIDDYIDEHKLPMEKFNRRNPLWQANYYDHVIRDGKSFEAIAEYIRLNPEKWEDNIIAED